MKLITVRYLGFTAMDRRFSNVMLPWILSEIRKRDSREQVSLGAEDGTLQAYNADFELQFSHKIQNITNFSQANIDPCSFLYLLTDDAEKLIYCYLYQAFQASDVSDIYHQMQEQNYSGPNLTSLGGDISPSSSHFFEVFYVGKIKVSHKKVPETFIEDALVKFRSHEQSRRASHDSIASTDSSSTTTETGSENNDTQHIQTSQNYTGSLHTHNRTMVLQVGRSDLRLISPDRKQVLLHRYHYDVTSCIQGARNSEYFSFVCRESHPPQNQSTPTQSQIVYLAYIFKCECSSVASDAVGAISQAANAKPNTTTPSPFGENFANVTTCEHCPMVWYHRLCVEIDGLGERKTQAVIFRRIEQLDDSEQSVILTKFRGAETDSTRDQNEFLMMLLRAHCEMKQNRHVHDTIENRSEFLNHYLGTGNNHPPSGTIFMKAKRSLSSSFEHLLKRKGSRDDFSNRELSLPLDTSSNCNTPVTSPNVIIDQVDNGKGRRRSDVSQLESGLHLSPEKGTGLKSPMMDIFMKVGNNSRSPNTSSSITSGDSTPQSKNSTPKIGGSWRQAIFNRVVTPNPKSNSAASLQSQFNSTNKSKICMNNEESGEQNGKFNKPRSKEELRCLWKRAIKQAILLVRMEKENVRLRACQEVSALKRVKLEYDEMSAQAAKGSTLPLWELLATGGSGTDPRLLLTAAARGVPSPRRGEVWQRLAAIYTTGKPPLDVSEFPNYDVPYENLLKQLTSHQHAILIDLGRTFPSHPYFRSPLGPGQLALFNLLKAYSLLDPDVGYCQGLSFVAGVLLLHMDEADAFNALKYLMFRRGMRHVYLPEMPALQVRLYQLSRLLHDRHPELYVHLDNHEVAPTLYAAPWFLTLFASQFPLGFVARVLDVLFVDGPDVLFRVALALLSQHAEQLLQCDSFEIIMDYLKTKLPQLDATILDKIMTSALATSNDITQRLNEYRVEYQVLQEEANSSKPYLEELDRLRMENHALLERNNALASQCEILLSNVKRLERTRTLQQSTINRSDMQIRTLEVSVTTLGTFIDDLVDRRLDVEIPGDVRRIVGQLMINERRKNDQRPESARQLLRTISHNAGLLRQEDDDDNSELINKKPPPAKNLVKSLSTGRIALSSSNGPDSILRSISLQSGNELERDLRLGNHRGVPLRVIDDDISSPKDKKGQNLSAKVSHFFSNTHNQILRQQRGGISPPPPSPPHHLSSVIREESREDISPTDERPFKEQINKNRENIDLSLQNTTSSTCDPSPSESLDSGMGTPMASPPGPGDDTSQQPHPLSGCDVSFTFNGTKKLKNIRTLRSLSRNSSPDLYGK